MEKIVWFKTVCHASLSQEAKEYHYDAYYQRALNNAIADCWGQVESSEILQVIGEYDPASHIEIRHWKVRLKEKSVYVEATWEVFSTEALIELMNKVEKQYNLTSSFPQKSVPDTIEE